MKKTSIYIPCFNAASTIACCLEAVLKQDYPVEEIVVVDDGSSDGTGQIAGRYPVRLLRHQYNLGLACARNTAIKSIESEYIAALDADCIPESTWLSSLMRGFDNPNIAGAGGKLVEDNISSVFDLWRSVHMRQYWDDPLRPPEFLFGSNTVFSKKALSLVGFYNEQLKNNYEDVDLSRRLSSLGYGLSYQPQAVCHHLKKDDLASLLNTYWRWHVRYYQEKEYYSAPESFAFKMKDNVGLANRYLEEDLVCARVELIYLDFLLVFHHCLKDLELLIFQGKDELGRASDHLLSSWLALLDLAFFYQYALAWDNIPTFLYPRQEFAQSILAMILVTAKGIKDRFKNIDFQRELYRDLLTCVYAVSDSKLLEKLIILVERHPDWSGFLTKKHAYIKSHFLSVADNIDLWLQNLIDRFPGIIPMLEMSQEKSRNVFCPKGASK